MLFTIVAIQIRAQPLLRFIRVCSLNPDIATISETVLQLQRLLIALMLVIRSGPPDFLLMYLMGLLSIMRPSITQQSLVTVIIIF